jgi:threonine/homoserine/homoserine lactone efflux protein
MPTFMMMASTPILPLAKRGTDWPHKNAGVMVVFVIAFLVAATLITLFVRKKLIARRLRREEIQRQMNA